MPERTAPECRARRGVIRVIAGVLGACVFFGSISGCGDTTPAPADDGAVSVVVSVPPLIGLLRPLMPEDATITTLIPAGASPHGHQFTPADLRRVASADLVLTVGLGLEPGLDSIITAARADDRVVSLADLAGIESDGHDHSHDHSHEHGHAHDHDHCDMHGPIDPHLWLDPVLMREALGNLAGALPDGFAATYGDTAVSGMTELAAKLDRVDAAYASRLADVAGRALICDHNAWPRLADRYGLRVAAVLHRVEGQEPTPGDVADVVAAIESESAGAIFIEPQFSTAVATRIAETAGARVLTLDPLGSGDWEAMMMANLEAMADGLTGPAVTDASVTGASGN